MIAENLHDIHSRMADAAARSGRNVKDVRIVAAAKGQGIGKIEEALAAGIEIIGHNYVQEAERNRPGVIDSTVEFHFIGHLQRNKAGKAVELFHLIQTVDDEKLAQDLDRRAEGIGRIMGVMIQVNLAGEPQKSGADPERLEGLVEAVRKLQYLELKGLMTMPPFFDDPDGARPYFARLRQLRDSLISRGLLDPSMHELSMGMTGDFEAAIEEGATLIRIGTALFGSRT